MNIKRLSLSLAFIVAAVTGLFAQTPAQNPYLDVSVERDQVRFTAESKTRQIRVEVYSPAGELVFNSGNVDGNSLTWHLLKQDNQPVADGVYIAKLNIISESGIIRKSIEQLMIIHDSSVDQLANIAAAPAAGGSQKVDGSGTPGKISKWTNTSAIGDSVITESATRIGIVTTSPTGTLHVDGGQPAASVTNGADADTLLQLSGGKGGNTTGVGSTAGAGADVSLIAGNGGDAPAGSTTGRGGNITAQPGSPGGGTGSAGEPGKIFLAPFGGNVGIGTTSPTSKLTVSGPIELNGIDSVLKFNDGTAQSSAGIASVSHNSTLSGYGTSANPLSIADSSVSTAYLADSAVTSSKIAVPLSLTSSDPDYTLSVSNTGSGVAITATGSINTSTQYNIAGARVLSVPGVANIFAGVRAGAANTTGANNTFFGFAAGEANTTASFNSFFGMNTGQMNTIGEGNSFFGNAAGRNNTIGSFNAFFGSGAGHDNTTGNANAFFGTGAGSANSTGIQNSFFGSPAGSANTTGTFNSFFGFSAGNANSTGGNNAYFGYFAGGNSTTGGFNAFFGASAGMSNTTASFNTFVGDQAGRNNITGNGNTFVGQRAGESNTIEHGNTFIGLLANGLPGISNATAIGANALVTTSNTMVLGTSAVTVEVPGNLNIAGSFNANSFSGNGSNLTNLNAGNITTGILDNARLGVVPASKGGTGLIASGAEGNFLRSDGSNWTSSALQSSDIPGGSTNYIQNATVQQPSSNFNISGDGLAGGSLSANIVNATTQYNLGGFRILHNAGTSNLFAGIAVGEANTGSNNAFFGFNAGHANSTGSLNAFFGQGAGQLNTTGENNAFFGSAAGNNNSTGVRNSFFGSLAGVFNTTGGFNAFFGTQSGFNNTTGDRNAFFGNQSGQNNTSGSSNVFFGDSTAFNNATGSGNTFLGQNAGSSNTTEDNNTFVGFNSNGAANITNATAIGANAQVTTSNTMVLGTSSVTVRVPGSLNVSGTIVLDSLASAGNTQLCLNSSNQIADCSSSLRYKQQVRPFESGLEIIRKLRPISFTWRDSNVRDIGFGAELMADIEPLLVTYNSLGKVEGVKYDRLSVVLVNAVHQQQRAIESLQQENSELKARLAALEELMQQIKKSIQ